MSEDREQERLIWIDLEMTGLDPERERIIEIATIVTDNALNVIAEGPVLAVHRSDSLLNAMDEWNTRTHGNTGLTERVRQSDIDIREAERRTLAFLAEYVKPNTSPMCGNSVHQDRRFMQREMPELEAFFHYRNLDVSTLKELARRWKPDVLKGLTKQGTHLALDDIRDSIEELKYYREHFLKL
ncbi:oligoribonuclease [Kushneria sinocarnis]|uniref:Oligoribonuclease n=1 Tax=Kushneria sinocarnis TaxID=595502 RepID=A0A420WTG3_9GAMM|nr:oligoribonuclease [Kushneria sinocarnis]RKQ96294.1 oligoribonuclease [Kushneria sinocarnis]